MDFNFLPSSHPDDMQMLSKPMWRDRRVTFQDGDEQNVRGWRYDHWERDLTVDGIDLDSVFQQARARLISLDIISSDLLEYTGQWAMDDRLPERDDLVFQRTHLLRIGSLRLVDVLSATRIGQVVDRDNLFSMQYIATIGHPEKGHSTFSIEKHPAVVKFTINTCSQPANILTRLAGPFITRRMQLHITNSLLDYVQTSVKLDLRGAT